MSLRAARLMVALVAAGTAGCDMAPTGNVPTVTPASFAVRAARRLYDGAPPVIPHRPLNIKCVACHTDAGQVAPPLGFAPANPHRQTAGLSSTSHCQQCHVFQPGEGQFAETDFRGLNQQFAKAERLYAGAPPVIPHRVFMRENCTSCHSGPAAREEIRCRHIERVNCRQCHVAGDQPLAP